MRILSFDASTTTIGYSILEYDGYSLPTLKFYSYFKPSKDGHPVERLSGVKDFVHKVYDEHKPDEIVIEDFLLGFNPTNGRGGTTIKTLTSLAVLNRTVCLAAFDKLGKLPILQSVMKIRHAIKENEGRQVPKKEEIPVLLQKTFGNINFPLQTKGKHKGELAVIAYDIADSIACGLAYCKLDLKNKNVKRKTSKKSRTSK